MRSTSLSQVDPDGEQDMSVIITAVGIANLIARDCMTHTTLQRKSPTGAMPAGLFGLVRPSAGQRFKQLLIGAMDTPAACASHALP